MISNFNYGSRFNANNNNSNNYYRQMSNDLDQMKKREEKEEKNFTENKKMIYSSHNNNDFLQHQLAGVNVLNLESFNLNMNMPFINFSVNDRLEQKHQEKEHQHNYEIVVIDGNDEHVNDVYDEVGQITGSNEIMNDRLDNCLAIDCNIESYSSLSSSSSTSSSLTSLSSSSNVKSCNENAKKSQSGEATLSSSDFTTCIPKSDSTSTLLIKNKKLNSLINGNRKNTISKHKILNQSKFASAECLSSCDEGYVGSYSDTNTNLNAKLAKPAPMSTSTSTSTSDSRLEENMQDKLSLLQSQISKLLSPEDQLNLLKFIFQNTLNNINEQQYQLPEETFSFNEVLMNQDECKSVDNTEQIFFTIPPIYSVNINDEAIFENLLNGEDKCSTSNPYYTNEFDILDKLQLNEVNSASSAECQMNLCTSLYADDGGLSDIDWIDSWKNIDMSKNEKLRLIQDEINRLKNEQEQMDELEMMTSKWRFILEKRRRLELIKNEFNFEDQIDANAYLNEIEMNIDYFTHDVALLKESTNNNYEDFSIDQMLRFKTNKMAFNLRHYHKNLTEKKASNLNDKTNRFANFHVDSIQEFVPIPFTNSLSSAILINNEEHDCDSINEEKNDLYTENNNENYEENQQYSNEKCQQQHHHHYHEENEIQTLDENHTLCDKYNNNNDLDYEHEYYDEEFYFDNEEDCEDYEDQMLIDSLTEEEALALLRSESEMYALQMAQAAKLGISMNEIKNCEPTQITTPEPTIISPLSVEAVTSAISTVSIEEYTLTRSKEEYDDNSDSNNDIFENVFNYDDQFECSVSKELEIEEPNEQEITVTESFYFNDTNYVDDSAIAATSSCSSAASPTYFNSNISVSLRNSLLKLRHSRRHLATLIETNKNSSTSTSSTTSSFTTNSSMSLYKQHMLNMQQQSKKPCVYMLNEGRCARADCRFVHDLKTITCKYWLEGECLKGDNCEFAHEYIEESEQVSTNCTRRNHKSSFSSSSSHKQSKKQMQIDKDKEKAALKLKKIDFKLDTEEFPELGGGGGAKQSNTSIKETSETKTKQVTSPTTIKTNIDKELPNANQQSKIVASTVPAKTAASILFSNVTKTINKSQTENRNAVNIVQNKQQQQNIPNSKTESKNSKQTGTKISDTTQKHKSRDQKTNDLKSNKNSRPNSKKSHK